MPSYIDLIPGVEELPGSPTFAGDRKSGTATRSMKVPAGAMDIFMLALFPQPYIYGSRIIVPPADTFPGRFWLIAKGYKVKPFFDMAIKGTSAFPATYDHYQVDIDYSTPTYDQPNQQNTHNSQHSGPGGKAGSSAGHNDVIISVKVTNGGEFLTWPNGGLSWDQAADSTMFLCDAALAKSQKQLAATQDVNAGIVIPTIEHHITWHFVPFPPWSAIRRTIGKVNAYPFAGGAPETILFMGMEASSELTTGDWRMWTLSYKFSEKNNNFIDSRQTAFGWNHFLRPNGNGVGQFQRLRRKLPGGSTALGEVSKTNIRDTSILHTGFAADPVSGSVDSVVNSTGFSYCSDFIVRIDSEYVKVNTQKGQTTWSVLERAMFNSTRATHKTGATVTQVYKAKLSAAMNKKQTTIYLDVNDAFPSNGSQFYIQIDQEIMAVIATGSYYSSSNTLYGQFTVIRGVFGTIAAAHSNGTTVDLYAGGVYDLADFGPLFVAEITG